MIKYHNKFKIDLTYWQDLQAQMREALDKFLLNEIAALPQQEGRIKHINSRGKRFAELTDDDLPITSYASGDNFVKVVPLIKHFCKLYDLEVSSVTIPILKEKMTIHVDSSYGVESYEAYRKKLPPLINSVCFPTYNTENTETVIYDIIYPENYYATRPGKRTLIFQKDELKEIDRFTIDSPCVMRIDLPHGVDIHHDKIRSLFSIKFNKNPLILYEL
jgi:hypothetical protein